MGRPLSEYQFSTLGERDHAHQANAGHVREDAGSGRDGLGRHPVAARRVRTGTAWSEPYSAPRNNPAPGVYRSALPNGNYVNLMRVMFTDFCKMDCAFCPNSHWVPRRRFAFKVDELANAFMEMYRRHTVAGLFLSSGVAGTGSKTTEKMTKVVDLIRNKHGFRGYIHMKVMPGTEMEYVEAAYRLGTRLSVNLEAPNPELMSRLSAMKEQRRDILAPMEWIDRLTRSTTNAARWARPRSWWSAQRTRRTAAAGGRPEDVDRGVQPGELSRQRERREPG